MRKLSSILAEAANVFPSWSKVRYDEQSVGQRILNSAMLLLEEQQREVIRHAKNYHLTTANLDEMDWAYRAELPSTFSFADAGNDLFETTYAVPTVSGVVGLTYYDVEQAEDNDLRSLWYEHVPNRVSLAATLSGNNVLLDDYVTNAPFSGVLDPFTPTKLSVELSGGVQYISINDEKRLERAQVIIHGTTRKGTEEEEVVVFPWDQTQETFKEWEEIDRVECLNIESGVNIVVRVCDFNAGPNIDFWNLEYSDNRNKIDKFWDIGSTSYGSTADVKKYSTDDIRQMLDGIYQVYVDRRFELLDSGNVNITAVDVAQQPFSSYLWAVTEDKLYCYDSSLTTVEDVSPFSDITAGHEVEVQLSFDHVVRGEEAEVAWVNADYQNPVYKYQAWVTFPDATVSGVLAGQFVPYVEGEYTKTTRYQEFIDQSLFFTPDQLGEHAFALSAIMADETTHVHKRVLCVDYKTPLAEYDLPATASGVLGIDFDGDQKMWVSGSGGYSRINLHHDVMLTDYENKVLYFREPYDSVVVS